MQQTGPPCVAPCTRRPARHGRGFDIAHPACVVAQTHAEVCGTRGFRGSAGADGRLSAERYFSGGVGDAVEELSYTFTVQAEEGADALEAVFAAMGPARAAAVADGGEQDPAATGLARAMGIGVHTSAAPGPVTDEDGKGDPSPGSILVSVVEAYCHGGCVVVGQVPEEDSVAGAAWPLATLGPQRTFATVTVTDPGYSVLGLVLRSCHGLAGVTRQDAEGHRAATLPVPPVDPAEVTPDGISALEAAGPGEDAHGDISALVLPWEVESVAGPQARLQGGPDAPLRLPLDLEEEGLFTARLVLAPVQVVAAALEQAASGQGSFVQEWSDALLAAGTSAPGVVRQFVGGSLQAACLPGQQWEGWDSYTHPAPVLEGVGEGGPTVLPSIGSGPVRLASLPAALEAGGGALVASPPPPLHGEAGDDGDGGEGGGDTSPLEEEQAIPLAPFTHVSVGLGEQPPPPFHRPQFSLVDREGLVSLARAEGAEVVPTSGPQMYGLNAGLCVSVGTTSDDGTELSAPITGATLVTGKDTMDIMASVGQLDTGGDTSWSLMGPNLADLLPSTVLVQQLFAAEGGASAGAGEGGQVDPPCVYIAVQSSSAQGAPAAAPPLLDIALGLAPDAVPPPPGYDAASCTVGITTPGGAQQVQVAVTLITSADTAAVQEQAAEAVAARSAALAGGAMVGLTGEDGMPLPGVGGSEDASAAGRPSAALGGPGTTAMEEEDAAEAAAMRVAEYHRLMAELQEATARQEALAERNVLLQRHLVAYFDVRKTSDESTAREGEAGGGPSAGALQRYRETLQALAAKRAEFAEARDKQQHESLALQRRIEARKAEAVEISQSLSQWKRTVAGGAANSITGRPLDPRDVQRFEEEEAARDADVERARVKNIKLKGVQEDLAAKLRAKEHLADGLALIDFEQLKIENSTLNEKIEDRNEELHKLRKKTTTTVQVLTHVKEKLQFVAVEAGELAGQLAEVEATVRSRRDEMASLKAQREAQRSTIEAKKTEQGFAHDDMLAKDFERRKRDMKAAREEVAALKARHAKLTAVITKAQRAGLMDAPGTAVHR